MVLWSDGLMVLWSFCHESGNKITSRPVDQQTNRPNWLPVEVNKPPVFLAVVFYIIPTGGPDYIEIYSGTCLG